MIYLQTLFVFLSTRNAAEFIFMEQLLKNLFMISDLPPLLPVNAAFQQNFENNMLYAAMA